MDLIEPRKLHFPRIISELPYHSATWRIGDALISFPSNVIPYKAKYAEKARAEYDKDLAAIVLADKPDLVVCAGYMAILENTFLDPLAKANISIINLHPALPVCATLSRFGAPSVPY